MNRIESIFAKLRSDGRKGLMPFVTAGYPSMDATAAILPAIERAGGCICEIGFPFSDPIADGPVISASMTDALAAGATPGKAFDVIRSVREQVDLGLVAMVSYSIAYRIGMGAFIEQARQAGVDGFIFPDLPIEEAEATTSMVKDAGLTASLLVAPTTPPDRAERIAKLCSGFVYVVARTGITGERDDAPEGLDERVAQLRQSTDLPIAVGFGIGKPHHVASVVEHADAAIVGSALVRKITEHKDESPEQIAAAVEAFVADLATGLSS
jgi:tryptophan synthase alpha chain